MNEPTKTHMIAVFTEDYFREIIELAGDRMYADGYTAGISTGASYYGAGACAAYVLDDNGKDEMREYEKPEEVERALTKAALARIANTCKDML